MDNKELIVEAVAVLIGKYSSERKKAAKLILRALLPAETVNVVLKDIAETKLREAANSKD